MSTTATKPRQADLLAELSAREQAAADAKARASELGSEWGTKARELEALQNQRRRLIHPVVGDPALVDHTDAPNPDIEENPVAAIDAQVAELGDLADLHARVQHARQLEQSAKQAADDFAAAHLDELLAALGPDAEASVSGVVDAMAALGDAARTYLNLARRVDGLKSTDRARQNVRVPAVDTASDLVRMAEGYGTPPSPTDMQRWPG